MVNSEPKMTEQYSLKWNNFHANLTTGFHGLFEDEDLVDVSLAVEGKIIQAHKVILSVCSPYFKSLFRIHPEKHPIVFLKDVGYSEVIGLLQFMYQGQVDVSQDQLTEFLRVAEMLQIKGLTSCNSDNETTKNTNNNNNSNLSTLLEDPEPLIPVPILASSIQKSTPIPIAPKPPNWGTTNGPSNNVNNNNVLKRKKPSSSNNSSSDTSSEPSFKIVNVESLKKTKTSSEDSNTPSSQTNGCTTSSEIEVTPDSPTEEDASTTQEQSQQPSKMIPKLEPVDIVADDDYNDSNYTDYSDVGENFMTHFIMEEPQTQLTESPLRSQLTSFGAYYSISDQQKNTTPPPSSSNTTNSVTSGEQNGPPTKLTTQQIMNIDVSLLQEQASLLRDRYEIAQVISKKLYYRGFYYRREKMTYNKKLMWKCVSYSKTKCLGRIHTYDGRIIYCSDKHNHLPHCMENDQTYYKINKSRKNVYKDGYDFIGSTTSNKQHHQPVKQHGSNRINNLCYSLVQNISNNLKKLSDEKNNNSSGNNTAASTATTTSGAISIRNKNINTNDIYNITQNNTNGKIEDTNNTKTNIDGMKNNIEGIGNCGIKNTSEGVGNIGIRGNIEGNSSVRNIFDGVGSCVSRDTIEGTGSTDVKYDYNYDSYMEDNEPMYFGDLAADVSPICPSIGLSQEMITCTPEIC